jgi:hypothetical protein
MNIFSDKIGNFLIIALTFFAPLAPLLAVVGLAILIDTITGRWAAAHEARKKNIAVREYVTSKKTREGFISKSVTYSLSVILFYLLDYSIINEFSATFIPWQFIATKVVVLYICWIEWDSIDEKYYRVKGVSLKDKFRKFTRDIKGLLTGILKLKNQK